MASVEECTWVSSDGTPPKNCGQSQNVHVCKFDMLNFSNPIYCSKTFASNGKSSIKVQITRNEDWDELYDDYLNQNSYAFFIGPTTGLEHSHAYVEFRVAVYEDGPIYYLESGKIVECTPANGLAIHLQNSREIAPNKIYGSNIYSELPTFEFNFEFDSFDDSLTVTSATGALLTRVYLNEVADKSNSIHFGMTNQTVMDSTVRLCEFKQTSVCPTFKQVVRRAMQKKYSGRKFRHGYLSDPDINSVNKMFKRYVSEEFPILSDYTLESDDDFY